MRMTGENPAPKTRLHAIKRPAAFGTPMNPYRARKKAMLNRTPRFAAVALVVAVRRRVVTSWPGGGGAPIVQSSNSANDVTTDDISVRVNFRPGGYCRLQELPTAISGFWISTTPRQGHSPIGEGSSRRTWLKPDRSARYEGLSSHHTGDAAAGQPTMAILSSCTRISESSADTDGSRLGSLGGGSGQCRNS